MKNFLIYFFTLFSIFPLFSCHKYQKQSIEVDNKSYINDFELLQENSRNDTRIKITSPKAIINPINNDIEIFDSSIEILNKNGQDIKVKAGKSSLNNYKKLIRVYNKVKISLVNRNNSFFNTNSFDWDLNTSKIYFNSPLIINFENTLISSSNGSYNIDSGQLDINNTLFNRNFFNKDGELIYKIKIKSDIAKWFNHNNALEFTSNDKQVETTIDFLSIK